MLEKLKNYFSPTKPYRTHFLLTVATLSLVAISISIGSGRPRQEAAKPKLRYTTSWPLKYHTGKPITTPILYCSGEDQGGEDQGYYATNDSFTSYDATADDLCISIPSWRWISSPILLGLFAPILVALYICRYRLELPNSAKHVVVVIVVLGARYYYWRQTDEPNGADFDSSDHVLLLSVYIWALLWHSWLSGKSFWVFLVFDMLCSVAFLISLIGTAGIFHTVDETWAGWRDAAYFLVAAGLLATFADMYEEKEGRYTAAGDDDDKDEELMMLNF